MGGEKDISDVTADGNGGVSAGGETPSRDVADTGDTSGVSGFGGSSAFIDEDAPTLIPGSAEDKASYPRLEGPGSTIGHYKLLELLGEGGFGAVYGAQQEEPVRRRVALKVIKMGMDTHQVMARFEAERQALAMMDHPCIAKVLDAGATETGRPFFVMELVKGISITSFCEQEELSTEERLDLFIEVCHAVQHAHQKGIIHRDLKPSNILVALQDGNPAPKVIDFGIAKAMTDRLGDQTVYTEQRQLIGTPAYMSPEQAEMSGLDIDTRSDIYSLGVVLYELLTGETPVDSATLRSVSFEQMSKLIRDKEPQKPSTRVRQTAIGSGEKSTRRSQVAKQLKGDLDWIILKAIEKDRARRYETANAFAADIERHKRHEPVVASPPSTAYRFSKFARRNRLPLAAAAAVFVALLSGLTAAAIGFTQAATQRDRAVAAKIEAEAARDESEAVTGFLADMLAAVDPGESGRNVTVREVLDNASASIQADLGDKPLVEARLRETMGASYLALGLYDDATRHLPAAMELRRAELESDDLVVLGSMSTLARFYSSTGDYERARSTATAALESLRAAVGDNDPRTLEAAFQLALIDDREARYDDAESGLKDVLERRRLVLGEDHRATLQTERRLARLYRDLGRWEESGALTESTIRTLRQRFGADHPDTLDAQADLAWLLRSQGELAEAAEQYRQIVLLMSDVLGAAHPKTLIVTANLAQTLVDMGEFDEAEVFLISVLSDMRSVLGDRHPDTLRSISSLGVIARRQGSSEQSVELLSEAVEGFESVLGTDHPSTLGATVNLANALMALREFELARDYLDNALAGYVRALGEGHENTISTMITLAIVYRRLGLEEDAERTYLDALETSETHLGASHRNTLVLTVNLAVLYREQQRFAEAEPLFVGAIGAMEQGLGETHPARLQTMGSLVTLYESMGKSSEAIELLRTVVALRIRSQGQDAPSTQTSIEQLAGLLLATEQYAEAIPILERQVEKLMQSVGDTSEATVTAQLNLLTAYASADRVGEAHELAQSLVPRLKLVAEDEEIPVDLLLGIAAVFVKIEPIDLRDASLALQYLDRAESMLENENPEVLVLRAEAHFALGQNEQAVRSLRDAILLTADANRRLELQSMLAQYEAGN